MTGARKTKRVSPDCPGRLGRAIDWLREFELTSAGTAREPEPKNLLIEVSYVWAGPRNAAAKIESGARSRGSVGIWATLSVWVLAFHTGLSRPRVRLVSGLTSWSTGFTSQYSYQVVVTAALVVLVSVTSSSSTGSFPNGAYVVSWAPMPSKTIALR